MLDSIGTCRFTFWALEKGGKHTPHRVHQTSSSSTCTPNLKTTKKLHAENAKQIIQKMNPGPSYNLSQKWTVCEKNTISLDFCCMNLLHGYKGRHLFSWESEIKSQKIKEMNIRHLWPNMFTHYCHCNSIACKCTNLPPCTQNSRIRFVQQKLQPYIVCGMHQVCFMYSNFCGSNVSACLLEKVLRKNCPIYARTY